MIRIASLGDDWQVSEARRDRPVWRLLQQSKRETTAWTKAGAVVMGLSSKRVRHLLKPTVQYFPLVVAPGLGPQCQGARVSHPSLVTS